MQPTVWSTDAKEYIYNKLAESQITDVQTWADLVKNSPSSDQFEVFCSQVHKHDQYRGLRFATVFPELSKWVTQ
jgi:hypothetical protein